MGPAEETVAAGRYENGGSAVSADLDLNEADGEFAAQTGAEGVASTPEESTPPAPVPATSPPRVACSQSRA